MILKRLNRRLFLTNIIGILNIDKLLYIFIIEESRRSELNGLSTIQSNHIYKTISFNQIIMSKYRILYIQSSYKYYYISLSENRYLNQNMKFKLININ